MPVEAVHPIEPAVLKVGRKVHPPNDTTAPPTPVAPKEPARRQRTPRAAPALAPVVIVHKPNTEVSQDEQTLKIGKAVDPKGRGRSSRSKQEGKPEDELPKSYARSGSKVKPEPQVDEPVSEVAEKKPRSRAKKAPKEEAVNGQLVDVNGQIGDVSGQVGEKKKPAARRRAKPKAEPEEESEEVVPAKRKRASTKLVTTEETVLEATVADEDEEGGVKKTRRKRTKVVAVEDAEPGQPKKTRTRVKVKDKASGQGGHVKTEEEHFMEQTIIKELLPVIPFEKSQHVRLGYACLCMELRNGKPPVFCSRTMILKKLAELGSDEAKNRASQNLSDLKKIMRWNEARGIRFFRITSQLFPHLENPLVPIENRYDLSFATDTLRGIGDLAKELGHRLTFHPSHFNQLASSGKVLDGTIGDLAMHARILDAMGCDQDSVMIVHGGGAYGDLDAAKVRVLENLKRMPEYIRRRLVFENDERIYTIMDLLPLSEELQIPICVDYFHHQCYGEELFDAYDPALTARIHKVWQNRGIKPKCHFSEQSPGDRVGAHSRDIFNLPDKLLKIAQEYGMDIMLESKDKESSLQHMHDKYFKKGIDGDRITWVIDWEKEHAVTERPKIEVKTEPAALEEANESE